MARFRVMRQRILIEEVEVEANTEDQARRIAEAPAHKNPLEWVKTEERDFILQAARISL